MRKLRSDDLKIIEHINTNGRISVGELTVIFGISRQAALKEISKLVDLDVVKLLGKGRGAHYVII